MRGKIVEVSETTGETVTVVDAATRYSRGLPWLWFSFRGRATRNDLWLRFALPYIVLTALANGADIVFDTSTRDLGWIGLSANVLLAWPSLAVQIKRLHDRDMDGAHAVVLMLAGTAFLILFVYTHEDFVLLLGVCVLVYGIYLLVQLGFLSGTAGTNRFGVDPLQPDDGPAAADRGRSQA